MTTATTSLVPVEAGLTGDYLPPVDPKAVEQALLIGDLSKMTNEQRIAYYVATCRSLGLNPLTKPFQAIQGDDGKLGLYPDKGCAEQLRKLHKVSIRVLEREIIDGLYVVTVQASTPDGRTEESQGVVPLVKAKGVWEDYTYNNQARKRFKPQIVDGQEVFAPLSAAERATAIMRAETKAKRRVTLAICGLGLPDWDAEPTSSAHPMALTLETTPRPQAPDTLTDLLQDVSGASDKDALEREMVRGTRELQRSQAEKPIDIDRDLSEHQTDKELPTVVDSKASRVTSRGEPKTRAGQTAMPFDPAESAAVDAAEAARQKALDEASNAGVEGSN